MTVDIEVLIEEEAVSVEELTAWLFPLAFSFPPALELALFSWPGGMFAWLFELALLLFPFPLPVPLFDDAADVVEEETEALVNVVVWVKLETV